jgi:hypothetical protein
MGEAIMMATAHDPSTQEDVTQGDNDAWHQFSEETRQELLHDDSEAWRRICGILLAIVIAGVTGGGLVVYLISR